jgi:hypothetical protein
MMGPLTWYSRHGYLSESAKAHIRVIYSPIGQLCRMSPVIDNYVGSEFGELWEEPKSSP